MSRPLRPAARGYGRYSQGTTQVREPGSQVSLEAHCVSLHGSPKEARDFTQVLEAVSQRRSGPQFELLSAEVPHVAPSPR